LLPAAAARTEITRRKPARLLLFIFLLFVLILVVVFVVGEVFYLVLVLIFVVIFAAFYFQLQWIEAYDVECGPTFVAGERFPFVQIFLIHVDDGVTTRAVDHCVSPVS